MKPRSQVSHSLTSETSAVNLAVVVRVLVVVAPLVLVLDSPFW